MERISINEAISNGDWLQCEYEYVNDNITMKFKLISIRDVQLEEIGDINQVDKEIPLRNGKLLLLSMELINFSKVKQYMPNFTLIDQDNFEFNNLTDSYLMVQSDLSKKYSLFVDLIPKFKYKVGFLFLVPPEEDTQYYIGVNNGIIKRI